MTNQITATDVPADTRTEAEHQRALEQMDRELLVAERIRDYSDEIYMHTRQQWVDWKRRVDRERAQVAERGNRPPGKRPGNSQHHYEGAKPRQEPFNFYAPTSPVSELSRPPSDNSNSTSSSNSE